MLACDELVVDRFNVVALAVAHAVAQIKSLRVVLGCEAGLVMSRVIRAHGGHGSREIRIEGHGALEVGKCGVSFVGLFRLHALRKGFQRFERRCCHLVQRPTEFLHGRERFAQLFPQLVTRGSQSSQHVVASRGLRFGARERVPVLAVHGLEADQVVAAHRADGAGQHRFAVRPHADFARHILSHAVVDILIHQLERGIHFFSGKHVQERRLLELNRESLLQRVVKNRVSGAVGKIGEDNAVPVRQRLVSVGPGWRNPGESTPTIVYRSSSRRRLRPRTPGSAP